MKQHFINNKRVKVHSRQIRTRKHTHELREIKNDRRMNAELQLKVNKHKHQVTMLIIIIIIIIAIYNDK